MIIIIWLQSPIILRIKFEIEIKLIKKCEFSNLALYRWRLQE